MSVVDLENIDFAMSEREFTNGSEFDLREYGDDGKPREMLPAHEFHVVFKNIVSDISQKWSFGTIDIVKIDTDLNSKLRDTAYTSGAKAFVSLFGVHYRRSKDKENVKTLSYVVCFMWRDTSYFHCIGSNVRTARICIPTHKLCNK